MTQKGQKPAPDWSWSSLKYYIYKDEKFEAFAPRKNAGIKDTTGKHFPDGMRIPEWQRYEVEQTKELSLVRRKLAAHGLKNPWLRNEVWRFDTRLWGTPMQKYLFIFRTLKYGVAAFIVTETLSRTVFKDDHHHKEDKYKLLYEMQ